MTSKRTFPNELTFTISQDFFEFHPYLRLQKWNFRDIRILNSTSEKFLVLAPLCLIKILASFVLCLMCLCVLELRKKLKKCFFLKSTIQYTSSITLAWLEKPKKISNMYEYIEMIYSFWNHDFEFLLPNITEMLRKEFIGYNKIRLT